LTHGPLHDRIARYLEEVGRFGTRVNLVGSTQPDALAVHVADSLAAASELPAGARVVDLGSGAGFPGIPIALSRPDLSITLVEVRERRVAFLRHVVRLLDLGCDVHRGRIEDPPEILFDYALLRAVSPPRRALELGRGWVTERGEVWVWASSKVRRSPGTLAGEISLPREGRILRIRAHAVPRGTA
jgi:16S rRNA (guanine527-N7)-methyltransferase